MNDGIQAGKPGGVLPQTVQSTPKKIALAFSEKYFAEFAENCARNLQNKGYVTDVRNTIPQSELYGAVLVIGIHNFPKIPLLRKTSFLGFQTEQLPVRKTSVGRLRRNSWRFRTVRGYYDQIFEWNPSLVHSGVGGSVFVPYGCRPQKLTRRPKKYEVVFIGNLGGSSRRRNILEQLTSQFDFYPDFSPGFDSRKDEAIHLSKICLNVHYYEDCGFESPRIFDYLSRGGFVLSERASSTRPFHVGKDLEDFHDVNDLVTKIHYYLRNDNARQEIAQQGHATASAYDYEYSSNLVAQELERALETNNKPVGRTASWARARARCQYMAFRDYLSLKRRGESGQKNS